MKTSVRIIHARYDLLCLEGLAQALRVFIEEDNTPKYTLANISKESMMKMHVKQETDLVRPHVVCAVLRDITFDESSYNSFIDLQDKIHQNIFRRRTLVAIGAHDLDTLQAPFSYEEKEFRADELMEQSDMKLKKSLDIIEGNQLFPVIYDSNRTVLSPPPIINGAHSAIILKTMFSLNVHTKAKNVLNTMVTAFSAYCKRI